MTATLAPTLPIIIQGGMGVAVSSWQLARAVSMYGQLGVVSGTCIDTVFVRRLQDGDVGGHLRRAMERFPLPEVSAEALRKYFLPEGREPDAPYKLLSMWHEKATHARQRMAMLASFVEVSLAKEAHDGLVGVNLLTKVQLPNLATLYGATLAGVGPATASAVTAAVAPELYPFFDELVAAQVPGLGKVAWTLSYYGRYAAALRERADALGAPWTPVMVERALWSSVGGKTGST